MKTVLENIISNLFKIVLIFAFMVGWTSCKKDIKPTSAKQINNPAKGELNKILFVNADESYIVGGSRYEFSEILASHDAGSTWSIFNMGDEGKKALYGITSFEGRTYGVSFDGKIFIKAATNVDWRYVQTNYWEWFQDITFPEANKGFIVAGNGYRSGRIYQTDSLGSISKLDTFEFELCDIDFPTQNIGYACGYGAVLKTDNAGDSWNLLDVQGDYFKSLYCVDANNIWAVGYNGSIIHTTDGGQTWDKQRNGNNPLSKKYRFRAVVFKDVNTGYAAGDNGLLLKTTDGGEHWTEFEHITDSDFRCLAFHPNGSLWAAGTEGVIFEIIE